MSITRALRLLGYVLVATVALPTLLDPSVNHDRYFYRWLAAYVCLAISFHVGASAREGERARRVIALAAQSLAIVVMTALLPCHFLSLSLVVVASQAALVLDRKIIAVWVAGLTGAVGWFLISDQDVGPTLAIAFLVAIVGFQAFSIVAVSLAKNEAAARLALARTNAELQATRSLLEASSRAHERTRIARELHDVLGHDLTALGLQLEIATHLPPDEARAHVAKAQATSARLLHDVREVVSTMQSSSPLDLAAALRALVENVPGLAVHLELPEPLAVDDAARAQCIVRCVQEIVTNAMRHARARNLWITLAHDRDGGIRVEARDDGQGACELRAGNGLRGMRDRFEEVGGFIQFASAPERAFSVSAWLPGKGASA